MEDHLLFSLSEKKDSFFPHFVHSMGGKLHNGKACIKDIAYFFVSSYLVGIEMICAFSRPSVCKAPSYLCHSIEKLSGTFLLQYVCQL